MTEHHRDVKRLSPAIALIALGCARGGEQDVLDSGLDTGHDQWEAVDSWEADTPADMIVEMDVADADEGIDSPIDSPVDPIGEDPVDPGADDAGGAAIESWDFALCPDGWSAASLGHSELPSLSWECGTPTSGPMGDHSGDGRVWATRLHSNYRDFEWSALTSPAVDLAGVTGGVTLDFWHWYEFEWCTSTCGAYNPEPCALDGGNVEVFDGSAWVRVTPSGGYPGTLRFFDSYYTHPLVDQPGYNADGTESTWVHESFDVSAYRNGAFRIRFLFGSDSGVNEAGWYIDDVRLASP